MKELARTVKEARERMSMSQFELAVEAGVSPGTISLLETGKRIPRVETLSKICRVLGLSYEEAVYGERTEAPERTEVILARNPQLIKDPLLVEAVLKNLLAECLERERIESEDETGPGESGQ